MPTLGDKMSKKTAQKSLRFRSNSDKKKVVSTKLALLVLAILILTIVFGKVFHFYLEFYLPKTDNQIYKNYVWEGGNINLVVNNKQDLALLSLNLQENKITILNIPTDTYLQVPQKHGSWMVSSVYNLGQTSSEPIGNRLLVYSLSNFLGLPIDGYLQSKTEEPLIVREMVEGLRQNPLNVLSYYSRTRSNLNKSEMIRFLWGISRVRFDKVKEVNLQKYLILTSLADGTKVLTADNVKLDALALNFVEEPIKSERMEIAVVNATDIPGLALKASRLIENIGGDVIITTTSASKSKHSFIVGKESKTFDRLSQVFNSACLNNPKCDKIDINGLQLQNRADVMVVLGEDFNNRF